MKKTLIVILLLCLLAVCAVCGAACTEKEDDARISVVCTVFPVYDWVRNLVGDENVKITMLLDSGADLHSYNPSAKDMLAVSQCDLFIYVGGESDDWVDDVLRSYPSDKRVALNLMEALGDKAREEEELEGAEEEEHDHEEEETEYDEHIWLSLKNASFLCEKIAAKLAAVDAEYAQNYQNNASSYLQKLNALDASYEEAVNVAPVKTLVFCDRFPFLYMMKDYGLTYYAAFSGCSTETNASFKTIKFLADKVNENALKNVIVLESSDQKVARSVINETSAKNQTVIVLDSLQSVGGADAKTKSYLGVMENNLNVLKRALQ